MTIRMVPMASASYTQCEKLWVVLLFFCFLTWSQGSSSLENLDQYDNNGDDQKNMQNTSHRVPAHQSKQPHDQKNDKYSPQHILPPIQRNPLPLSRLTASSWAHRNKQVRRRRLPLLVRRFHILRTCKLLSPLS